MRIENKRFLQNDEIIVKDGNSHKIGKWINDRLWFYDPIDGSLYLPESRFSHKPFDRNLFLELVKRL